MKISFTIILIVLISIPSFLAAQNQQGFIHGTITTIEGDSYTGALRWGKEEIYWTDFFNATKTENQFLDYVEDDELQANRTDSWSKKWMSWSGSRYENIHQWVCQFGDLRSIQVLGRSKIKIELKDGQSMRLGDGSNDVGATVKVMDSELGVVELSWNRIDRIDFSKTPSRLEDVFGERLYGIVETSQGSFEGIVQWDHDERISTDQLDGESEDGDFSIKFGKIQSIENQRDESLVTLLSGRKLQLEGTNDVDDGNRGIIVTIEGLGRVDIPWEEFKKVTFDHGKRYSGPAYNDFPTPGPLNGRAATTDGRIFTGKIAYDLDETLDIEIIQGKDNEIEYLIPLKNISKIAPKSYDFATVTLKNGNSILIGEGQDVSDRNDGILIFTDSREPEYVSWDELKEIDFK